MKLIDCLEIGEACGLNLVGEALYNIQHYALSLFNYSDILTEEKELFDETEEIIKRRNLDEVTVTIKEMKSILREEGDK